MKGDAPLRYAASAAISLYQRRLSPLKGSSCAHRVLNGGDSCSRHIKDLVLRLGPGATLTPARERLTACREANEALCADAVWLTPRRDRRRRAGSRCRR